MSDVRDSMRDYINVIANPAEPGLDIPASVESEAAPSVDPVSPSSMSIPSEREVHGVSHDPEQNAPLTAMNTPASQLVGRIGGLAQAIQAAFEKMHNPDSYFPDDMHDQEADSAPEAAPEEMCGHEEEESSDYEQSQQDSDSRELIADEEELDEGCDDTPEQMAPNKDQAGHRSYADAGGSSFAARKGMTG